MSTEKKTEKQVLIGYPPCSICKKAEKFLQSHKINYIYRNIKTESLSSPEIEGLWKASNLPLKKFFNTSGLVYRGMGLSETLPSLSESEQLTLLGSDGMLVKRPILVTQEGVCVGFKEAEWMDCLGLSEV